MKQQKKQKKSLFEVESVAMPEAYLHPRDSEGEEESKEVRKGGKHHLHWKNGTLAVPEIEVEDN